MSVHLVLRVKEAIANEVVTEVVRRYPSAAGRVRYGVLIYRDFCDKDRQFERLDFTTDVSRVVAFLDTVKATGGGDPAEDVVGAMMEALRMDWKQRNKVSANVAAAGIFVTTCRQAPWATPLHVSYRLRSSLKHRP